MWGFLLLGGKGFVSALFAWNSGLAHASHDTELFVRAVNETIGRVANDLRNCLQAVSDSFRAFVSKREDGSGHNDFWTGHKVPNGQWSAVFGSPGIAGLVAPKIMLIGFLIGRKS